MNKFSLFYKLSDKCPQQFSRLLFSLLKKIWWVKKEKIDAVSYLNSIRPDIGQSCLCENIVNITAEYDLQIIVPVYNVEKYLEECLKSILSQKTKYKYFVTVINDGSPDRCGEILEKYNNRSNIKIITQGNKGLSGARNSALRKINAKYVMFVDSDDILCDNALDALLDCAISTNSDIVQGGYVYYFNDGSIRNGRHIETGCCDPQKLFGFAWGKLYKAHLWKNFQFPEKYLFEDTINKIILFNIAKKAFVIDEKIYMYRCNANGITATSKKNIKSIDSIWVTKKLIEDYKKTKQPITRSVCTSFLRQFMFNYSRLLDLNDKKIFYASFLVYENIFQSIDVDMSDASYGVKIAYHSLKAGDFKTFFLCCIFLRRN